MASRLTGLLRGHGGTLALSWLNLGEYAPVSDPALADIVRLASYAVGA